MKTRTETSLHAPPTGMPEWERRLGFSEIYLHHLPPQHREAFRQLARTILDLEPGVRWSESAEPRTREALGAAVMDLRVVQGFLAELGRQVEGFPPAAPDRVLAQLVGTVAQMVGQIADTLDWSLHRVSGSLRPG